MNHKLILILFLIVVTLLQMSCNNKNKVVDSIHFQYESARRIPYNKIIIDIKNNNHLPILNLRSFPMNNTPEWEYSKIDTSFAISLGQYSSVSNAIKRMIDNETKNQDSISGKDGSVITLEFQVDGVNKDYKIWSPNYETEERNLNNFLEVIKIIAKTANLKTNLVKE